MALSFHDIYTSPNGDRWRLLRDEAADRFLVRHDANPSSGGHVTELDADDFLRRGGGGPEHVAARQLLQSLRADQERDRAPPDEGALPPDRGMV